MQQKRIAIIGGGNLGKAIATGIIKSGEFAPESITVTRRRTEQLEDIKALGANVHSDNSKAVREADVVILALKPYKVGEILQEVSAEIDVEKQLIISVVTGVKIETLTKSLGKPGRIARVMPNTAIAVAQSMSCIATNDSTTPEDLVFIKHLFNLLGETEHIQEELMEAATVLAASGIAFALRYIRANMQGGIQIGFDTKLALHIATQTVKGAAELLLQNGLHPEEEIDKVTTPMGITIAGIIEMEHQGFSSSLIRGIATSYDKIGK
ncbi:MAG: pyrroline-5-carboxylate reductase [Bacteroidota bacterium]|jgi:pyrroline-5-carboxylate reductase